MSRTRIPMCICPLPIHTRISPMFTIDIRISAEKIVK
jgi:hypothetical protein